MLAASTLAQAAAAVMMHGPAFLIPTLHEQDGLSLAKAGLVAAAPTIGVMLTLVAWGWVTDRRGERFVLLVGLAATVAFGVAAALTDGLALLVVTLFLAGGAAASTNAASGRVVVGWFPPERRGLAMGIRQMAQPVGVGVAAISIAVVASEHGVHAALWVPTVACALAAVLVAAVVIDPPRPERREGVAVVNPYRQDSYLARIHGVSVLLVVPQFLVWSFALVWLVTDRDWSPAAAGAVVAIAQVAGALGRIAAGHLSDVVGARMRPLRWVALAAAGTMALLGLTAALDLAVAVLLVVVATTCDGGRQRSGVHGRRRAVRAVLVRAARWACRTRRSSSPPPPCPRSRGWRSGSGGTPRRSPSARSSPWSRRRSSRSARSGRCPEEWFCTRRVRRDQMTTYHHHRSSSSCWCSASRPTWPPGSGGRSTVTVAAEIRSEADAQRTEIDQSGQQAAEAAARADLARAEAERVEQEAAEAQRQLEMDQARHEDVLREADSIDPDVDHRADDYRPGGAGSREP